MDIPLDIPRIIKLEDIDALGLEKRVMGRREDGIFYGLIVGDRRYVYKKTADGVLEVQGYDPIRQGLKLKK